MTLSARPGRGKQAPDDASRHGIEGTYSSLYARAKASARWASDGKDVHVDGLWAESPSKSIAFLRVERLARWLAAAARYPHPRPSLPFSSPCPLSETYVLPVPALCHTAVTKFPLLLGYLPACRPSDPPSPSCSCFVPPPTENTPLLPNNSSSTSRSPSETRSSSRPSLEPPSSFRSATTRPRASSLTD